MLGAKNGTSSDFTPTIMIVILLLMSIKKLRRIPAELVLSWSRLPDSDRGPHPYHGCALPTELRRQPIMR